MINQTFKLSTFLKKKVNSFCTELTSEFTQRHCYLCQACSHSPLNLCHACRKDLPWIKSRCLLCGVPLPGLDSLRVCGNCLKQPPLFERCITPFEYAFPIDVLIQRFKYNRAFHYGTLLSTLLATFIKDEITLDEYHHQPDLLLPVPLSEQRRKERGFNQSEVLATALSKKVAIPRDFHLGRRISHSAPQVSLPQAERKRNLSSAFWVSKQLHNKTIALVDDVVTTGSTVEAMTEKLLDAGATSVQVWALARTS